MSHWDSKKQVIVRWPTQQHEREGWIVVDCGCCAGIMWGGDSPRACDDCGGSGMFCVHVESRRRAYYPGGPFLGQMHPDDLARALAAMETTEEP